MIIKKKTSQAKFLKDKELKTFEALYQNLKIFPGFKMNNVYTYRTREEYAIREQVPAVIWQEFKHSNPGKLNLAIHEAGHAIVMSAVGETLESVVADFDEQGRIVKGYAAPVGAILLEETYEPLEIASIPCKPLIYMRCLVSVAGFSAETLFTNVHPCQYHEKFMNYVQLRYTDEQHECPSLHHWNYVVNWCAEILEKNEDILHRCVRELLKQKELSRTEITKLKIEVTQEPAPLFFY